jgi:MoxR-like ATPase
LPEAQLDRFLFKIIVTAPGLDDLVAIAVRTTGPRLPTAKKVIERARLLEMRDLVARVPVAEPVMRYAARLVMATRPDNPDAPEPTRRYVRYGASPRGLQSLVAASKVTAARDGRYHVSRDDLVGNLPAALRHRVLLTFEGELQKVVIDDLLGEIVRSVPRDGE